MNKILVLQRVVYLSVFFMLFFSFEGIGQLNISYYLAKGRNNLQFYKYSEAIEDFNIVIRNKPDYAEAYYLRAIAKYNLGDLHGAEEDYTQTIKLKSNAADAYYYRGITRIQLYNFHGAIEDFNRTMEFRPAGEELLTQRGYSWLRLDENNKAIKDFNSALEIDSTERRAYFFRSLAFLNEGDTVKTIEDLTRVLSIDSTYTDALVARGQVFSQQALYQKALSDLNKAVKADSDNFEAYLHRSMAYYHLGKLEEAMNDLDKVIELEPSNALAYYNRALLKSEIGAYDDAIEDYSKVLEFNPQNVLAYFNRALVEMERNNYTRAVRDFSLAINLYPDFAKAYMNRSIARAELDDLEGAYEDRQKARQIFSEYNTDQLEEMNFADTSENFKRLISLQGSKNLPHQFGNVDESIEPIENYVFSYIADKESNVKDVLERYTDVEKAAKKYDFIEEFKFDFGYYRGEDNHSEVFTNVKNKIEKNPDSLKLQYQYALLNSYRQNFNEAIETMNNIVTEEDNFLAFYIRANLRTQMIDYIRTLQNETTNVSIQYQTTDQLLQQPVSNEVEYHDYDRIIEDYNESIRRAPNFIYAYFNRANVKVKNKNYKGAIDDYGKAILIEPDFAEAYFNRGLTYIYLQNADKGCIDLSKAGELGIEKAYDAINFFCQ
ncbi:MAG: tetratricopeptide repeat protein [Bacteroidales bacterium]